MKRLYAVLFLICTVACFCFPAKAGSIGNAYANAGFDRPLSVTVTETSNKHSVKAHKAFASSDLTNLVVLNGSAVQPLSPTFDPTTTAYTVSSTYSITAVKVTPTASDPASTIKVNGSTVASGASSGAYSIGAGATITLTVVVTATDATTKTYTIQVTRAPATNANLSALAVNAGTFSPTFATETTAYNNVLTTQTSVSVRATIQTGSGATLTINGTTYASAALSSAIPVSYGNNTITIIVSAPDGVTKKTYVITSYKPSLTGLSTTAGTIAPNFSSNALNYNVSTPVPNTTTSVNITPTFADAGATLTINGVAATPNAANTVSLALGLNTFTLAVLAGDGVTTSTYTLKITRAPSIDATLSALAISDGTLSPTFAAATNSYTASVPNSTGSITLTPTVNNATATVTVNGTAVTSGSSSTPIALNVGANTIATTVTAGDGSTTGTYTVTVTRAASSNADLNGLSLNTGTLSPAFASSTLAYTATVPGNTAVINVTPTLADAGASVTVNGTTVSNSTASGDIPLVTGSNSIPVVVTAADGTVKTYTINVTRSVPVNFDLSGLTISAGTLTPAFSAATTVYTASVSNTITGITLTPTLSDPLASVKVNGTAVASGSASGNIVLGTGSNTINAVVTAQDGTSTKTYTVTVSRGLSANASLAGLTLSQGTLTPAFDAATNTYSASVANSVTGITVKPTVADANASVTVNGTTVTSGSVTGNIPLIVGANTITTKVTAQDGSTTNIYTLTVTRAASANANLSNITLSTGTLSPVFSSATNAYTTAVANAVTSVTITPTVSDATAGIKVNGTTVASGSASGSIPLIVGANTINTIVTAQNGATNTYTVTVTRAQSANNDLANLVFSTGTLTPEFDTAITSYSTGVGSTTPSLTVTPTVADATANIKVNGTTVASGSTSTAIPLVAGSNVINTVVTAQNGTTKTYTVNVTKSSLSPNSNLSNLTISTGTLSPVFAAATTDYTSAAANNVTSITITPTVADAAATVKINGIPVTSGSASSAINLVVGANTINIDVTAQNGVNVTEYTVVVTRAASSNANLSNLVLSTGTLNPVFASATTGYTVSVANSTASIMITPTVSDATASVKVNGVSVSSGTASVAIPLIVGTNTITAIVTAQDAATTKTYTITITRAPSAIADLSGLVVSGSTLSPSFTTGTTTYTASVSNSTSTVTVTPTATDATAKILVNGAVVTSGSTSAAVSLTVGTNTITTKVTAQDGTTIKTYTVTITKAASSNADLSGITLSAGAVNPSFASATTNYTATVSNATTSITVTPVTTDVASGVKVNGVTVTSGAASGAIPLSVGANTITLLVTAQDGTPKTYTIAVTRAQSGNADLAGVTLSSGTLSPAFAAATTSYTANVSNTTTSITLTPSVADATANVKVNGTIVSSGSASAAVPLVVGANAIAVAVTAQDGSTVKTYTVTVTRAQSSNANLAGITLSSGTLSPVFASATNTYTASVSNAITSITLTPGTADATATVKVNGTTVISGSASVATPLTVGSNTITTVVTAQDGSTTNTYTVVVTRAPSSVADLSALTTTAGALSPAFATGTLAYSVSVANTVTSVTVTPTLSSSVSTAKVNGVTVNSGSPSGAVPLIVGNNTINIIATAQDGVTTSTYTITIVRAPSAISSLSALAISSGTLTPAFSTGTITYTATVTNATTSITVTPTLTDATATIKVNGTTVASGTASGAIALNIGANVIATVVTAQNGTTTSTYTVTVNRTAAAQTITFNALSTVPFGTADFAPGATSNNSTIPITYTSSNTAVATIVSGNIHLIGVGTTNITASQAAGTGFLAATSVVQPLVVGTGTRTLTFNAVTPHTFGDADFDAGATVTTGEVITYTSSDVTVITVVSGKLHIVGGGTATITASVAANNNYNTITPLTQVVTINRATQTITFNPLPILKMGSYGLVVNLTASSNLPVTLSSSDNNIATVNGTNVAQVSPGVAIITATQAGNSNYLPVSVSQPLTVIAVVDLASTVQTHEGFSPNGDGINDFLVIDGITNYPDNRLTVVNRNGVKVAQINNYDNKINVFDGHGTNGSMLQQGTYFYSLEFKVAGVAKKKTGFVIIKNN